jgi:hypothetical protein
MYIGISAQMIYGASSSLWAWLLFLMLTQFGGVLEEREGAHSARLSSGIWFIELVSEAGRRWLSFDTSGPDWLVFPASTKTGQDQLTVPIVNRAMQEKYWLQMENAVDHGAKMDDLLATMYELSRERRAYPESTLMALRDAIALMQALKDMEVRKIPYYQQESYHTDQHYMLPLVTFLTAEVMKEFFASKRENKDGPEETFRNLLSAYVQRLYPANSLLPIGDGYDEFPFIVFRSLNLGEIRRKMFTGKYLFMSHEFNIINMLLSSKE